jgi:hypothetical protein
MLFRVMCATLSRNTIPRSKVTLEAPDMSMPQKVPINEVTTFAPGSVRLMGSRR